MADNDGITEVGAFSQEAADFLTNIASNFSLADAQAVKEIEIRFIKLLYRADENSLFNSY
jgi:hypothetical protein